MILQILNFYMSRISESSAFIYLIEGDLSQTWVDTENFTKESCHKANEKCP